MNIKVQATYHLVSLVSLILFASIIKQSGAFQRIVSPVNAFPSHHKPNFSPSIYKTKLGSLRLLARNERNSSFDKSLCSEEEHEMDDALSHRRQFLIQSTTAIIGYSSILMNEADAVEEEMKLAPTSSEYESFIL